MRSQTNASHCALSGEHHDEPNAPYASVTREDKGRLEVPPHRTLTASSKACNRAHKTGPEFTIRPSRQPSKSRRLILLPAGLLHLYTRPQSVLLSGVACRRPLKPYKGLLAPVRAVQVHVGYERVSELAQSLATRWRLCQTHEVSRAV
jgi:hypothetical protein